MDAERDTDGTTDAYEGDHTPADGAGTDCLSSNKSACRHQLI